MSLAKGIGRRASNPFRRTVVATKVSRSVNWTIWRILTADFGAITSLEVTRRRVDCYVWPRRLRASGGVLLVELEDLCLFLVKIGTWIRRLVFQYLDETVEANGNESA